MGAVNVSSLLRATPSTCKMSDQSDKELPRVYAYGDGCVDDFGWGCTYRNCQTLLHTHTGAAPEFEAIVAQCSAERQAYGRVASTTIDDRWIEPHQAGCYLQLVHQMESFEVLLIAPKVHCAGGCGMNGSATVEGFDGVEFCSICAKKAAAHELDLQEALRNVEEATAAAETDLSGCLSCTNPAVYQQEGNCVMDPAEQTQEVLQMLSDHLEQGWMIIDNGTASYCFLAVRGEGSDLEVLIGDPHRQRPDSGAGGAVGQLAAMGFSGDVCGAALRLSDGDVEQALNLLLSDMPKCVAAIGDNDSEEAAAAQEEQQKRLKEDLARMSPAQPKWRLAREFLKLDNSRACNWAFLFVHPALSNL